jgi:ribonuclease P protein component
VSSKKSARSYPASLRIKRREDFVGLQESGSKVSARNLLLIYSQSDKATSRFGIVVTRKLDPRATVRNRVKRKIREVLRLNRCNLLGNFEILIIARRGIAECSFQEIEKQILESLRRAKCI